jgi:hypothetical protein
LPEEYRRLVRQPDSNFAGLLEGLLFEPDETGTVETGLRRHPDTWYEA